MNRLYLKYIDIWQCHNPSTELNNIIKEIEKHLKGYQYYIDKHNNIFIGDFDKELPCLVAHMDSIHQKKSKRFYYRKNILRSNKGIGGDDKCGIVAILEILKQNKNVNAILTSDEEVGGIGALNIKPEKLKNVKYFIEIDRTGKNDIIFESGSNQIASDEFQKALLPWTQKYHFIEDFGLFTDVNILTKTSKKSAINVSCGYYKAHTKKEYVNLKDLQHTIYFVLAILVNIKDTFIWEDNQNWNNQENAINDILTSAYLFGANNKISDLILKAYELGQTEHEYNILDTMFRH